MVAEECVKFGVVKAVRIPAVVGDGVQPTAVGFCAKIGRTLYQKWILYQR